MKRESRLIIGAFLALVLAAAAGWVAMGYAGSNQGCAGKAVTASASGSPSAKAGGCPSARAGGCPSAKAGGCPSAGKMGASAAVGCCPGSKGAQAAVSGCGAGMGGGAGVLGMPEGTKMTRMDVPDGIDLIFTGKDLAAIRTCLDGHLAACSGTKEKTCPGQTCTVASTENSVVLSVRGPNAESCVTMMTASQGGEEAKSEPAKPAKKKWSLWKRS
jgi:hypothetical protein